MDLTSILEIGGNAIYAVMGLVALYGVFLVIFLLRRIAQKRFSSRSAEEAFLEEVRVELESRNFDGVAELCDSPRYWAKAVPQLILVALENRKRSPAKIRRLLAEKFERDVLADLEYRLSWINTIVKSAPSWPITPSPSPPRTSRPSRHCSTLHTAWAVSSRLLGCKCLRPLSS